MPVPVPVLTLNVAAPALIPYTTPLEVTAAPPSAVMVPPTLALEDVIDVADAVALMVAVFKVVKLVCAP